MRKKIIKLLMLACLAVSLAACGSESGSGKSGESRESVELSDTSTPELIEKKEPSNTEYVAPRDIDMKLMKEKMLTADSEIPEMSCVYGSDANASDLFAYLAAYDYKNVEDYFFAYAAGGTAEEVAVVKLKRSKDAQELKKALEKHVKSRTAQFETYDPEQVDLAKSAKIEIAGNYVALITCKNQKEVKKAFTDLVK